MHKKDCWDKSRIIFSIISSIVIPIVLGFYGYTINSTLKDREIKIQYVKIAVKILSNEPTEETSALRNWAIDVFSEYSEVAITDTVISELRETSMPIDYLIDDAGNYLTDDAGNFLQGN